MLRFDCSFHNVAAADMTELPQCIATLFVGTTDVTATDPFTPWSLHRQTVSIDSFSNNVEILFSGECNKGWFISISFNLR